MGEDSSKAFFFGLADKPKCKSWKAVNSEHLLLSAMLPLAINMLPFLSLNRLLSMLSLSTLPDGVHFRQPDQKAAFCLRFSSIFHWYRPRRGQKNKDTMVLKDLSVWQLLVIWIQNFSDISEVEKNRIRKIISEWIAAMQSCPAQRHTILQLVLPTKPTGPHSNILFLWVTSTGVWRTNPHSVKLSKACQVLCTPDIEGSLIAPSLLSFRRAWKIALFQMAFDLMLIR